MNLQFLLFLVIFLLPIICHSMMNEEDKEVITESKKRYRTCVSTRFSEQPDPGMVGRLGEFGELKFIVVSVKKLDDDGVEEMEKKQNILKKSKQKINLLHRVMYFDNAEQPKQKFESLFLDLKNRKYYFKDEKSGLIMPGLIYSIDNLYDETGTIETNSTDDCTCTNAEEKSDVSSTVEDNGESIFSIDENIISNTEEEKKDVIDMEKDLESSFSIDVNSEIREVVVGMQGVLQYKKLDLEFQVNLIDDTRKNGKYFISYASKNFKLPFKCETLDFDLKKMMYTAYCYQGLKMKSYEGKIFDLRFPNENYLQRQKPLIYPILKRQENKEDVKVDKSKEKYSKILDYCAKTHFPSSKNISRSIYRYPKTTSLPRNSASGKSVKFYTSDYDVLEYLCVKIQDWQLNYFSGQNLFEQIQQKGDQNLFDLLNTKTKNIEIQVVSESEDMRMLVSDFSNRNHSCSKNVRESKI